MLNKRLLCIIISFILGFMPILQYFPVFAAENAVIEENLTLCIQMIKEEDGDFKKNGNAEYVSGLQIDDCVLIDLEWISDKLGLLMQITDAEKKDNSVTKDMSYDIRKYQEGQEKTFANIDTQKTIRIRKNENNYLQYIFKIGAEKAFTYSPYLGEIVVDLGAKVTEQDGKIYVPLIMFLNLFESNYTIDEENVINLYPCKTTVVDIMHMTGLSNYYFDVMEEIGLNELQIATVVGYDEFYRKIKALFQGSVNLDIDTIMKAMPSDKTEVTELLTEMLLRISKDELQEMTDLAIIDANEGFYTVDFIQTQIKEGVEESLSETIQKWAEKRTENIKSTGFLSIDDCLKFEKQAAKEIASKESVKNNINNWCDAVSIETGLVNIAFSGFIKYITLACEVDDANYFYVNAMKTYIDQYNTLKNPFMEQSIITAINEKIKLYERKEINIFKNPELMREIFKDISNTTMSIDLSEAISYSAEKINSIYPSFKVKEFSMAWLKLQGVSIGWDVAEFFINQKAGGSLDSLDALNASLYAMLFQTDAYNIYKNAKDYQDLDEYRKLEWVRLRSYYITRQLSLMFYQPQQLLHPEEYKLATASIINESNELIELMTILAVGPTGLSQKKMTEISEIRTELDNELLEVIKTPINKEDELKTMLLNKGVDPILNFIYDDFDNNGVYEAIAFCGEYFEMDDCYSGTLYFITQNDVQIMREEDAYWNSGVIFNFGNTKIISIDKYFSSGAISYCYEINGMGFSEIEGSGCGDISQDEQGHIYITDSQYDALVDGTGHTWNIYYFYWDNGLREYGGTEISIAKFSEYNGADSILNRITTDGYDIISIYQRGNGIININGCDGYTNVNVRIILEDNNVNVLWDGEYFYEPGIIKPALIPQLATYSY